jgi:hypothetical protein
MRFISELTPILANMLTKHQKISEDWQRRTVITLKCSSIRLLFPKITSTPANENNLTQSGDCCIVLPLSICIERANHWAFWKAVGKSV